MPFQIKSLQYTFNICSARLLGKSLALILMFIMSLLWCEAVIPKCCLLLLKAFLIKMIHDDVETYLYFVNIDKDSWRVI